MCLKANIYEERKELFIFLAVTYGLPFLMTIPMAILFHLGRDLTNFMYAQAFYPAAGLISAKLICIEDKNLMPKRFFYGFLGLTGIMILWCFTGFLPDNIKLSSPLMIITIVIAVLYFLEKKENLYAYKLVGENWMSSGLLLVLFVVIFYLDIFIVNLVIGELPELMERFSLVNFPSFLAISICCFSL